MTLLETSVNTERVPPHAARCGVNIGNIPAELKAAAVWLLWAKIPNEKSHSGFDKVPICALDMGAGSSTKPYTWTDFDTALQALEKHYGDPYKGGEICGLGFALDGLENIFVVDIDDIGDGLASGDFEGSDMVTALASYTEKSVSGNGLHIICRGKKPAGRCRKGRFEIYESKRYMTITGDIYREFDTIGDCTEKIKPLYNKYFSEKTNSTLLRAKITSSEKRTKPQKSTENVRTTNFVELSDNEIICKCRNEKNGSGEKFARLLCGDTSDYGGDCSAADLAFCNKLAFYTNDRGQIDRIFRASGLMRDKWDERHSSNGSTYGEMTIERAVKGCSGHYTGGSRGIGNHTPPPPRPPMGL